MAVNDDFGAINYTPIPNSPQLEQTNDTNNNLAGAGTANSGTTTAGKSEAKTSANTKDKPLPRPNPLSNFSSYNYQLSWYMVTPDVFNTFEDQGIEEVSKLFNKRDTSGIYLLMQSGGINSSSIPRAPGFELDYYLDNLKIDSLMNPKETGTASMATKFTFQVTEPYGFSLLTKLKAASENIQQYSKIPGMGSIRNPSRHFFLFGLRFLGYDERGELITTNNKPDGRVVNPNTNGIFEKYYGMVITGVKFKIDGRATVYNIEAVSAGTKVQQVMESRIKTKVTIQSSTVEQAAQEFVRKLNEDEKNRLQNNEITEVNEYSVDFSSPGAEQIAKAAIATEDDMVKWNWGWYKTGNVNNVNDATSAKAQSNNTEKVMVFDVNSSVQMAFERIISQSTYLKNALDVVYYNSVQGVDAKTKDRFIKENKDAQVIRWYNLSVNLSIKRYDEKRKKFAYKITYVFSPYETPVFLSPYPLRSPEYYGPHKRYEYWFTGQNSEILNYEQKIDNGYFTVVLNPDGSSKSSGGGADIPTQNGVKVAADSTGGLNAQNKQSTGSYQTDIYDPKSFATAKITILGDPDFLVDDNTTKTDRLKIVNKFYKADGYTVNPNAGQVFIEIDFKEGIDYDNYSGVMTINDSISFWQYPSSVKKLGLKGVSYMLTKITHIFRGGKFTQELDAVINTFGNTDSKWETDTVDDEKEQRESQNELLRESRRGIGSAPTTSSPASVSKTAGWVSEQPVTYIEPDNIVGVYAAQPSEPTDNIDGYTIPTVEPEGRDY